MDTMEQTIFAKNLTDKRMRIAWDSIEYDLKPGGVALFPHYIANHFAKYYPADVNAETGELIDHVQLTVNEGESAYQAVAREAAIYTDPETGEQYASMEEMTTALRARLKAEFETELAARSAVVAGAGQTRAGTSRTGPPIR